ncbi:MAG: transcription-repair coupling factor [Verrucomicrobiota bacterium]
MQRTFRAETLRERTRQLNRGNRMDPLELLEQLQQQGYEPEAKVTQKGETSLRGGILDIYPPTSPWPVRLEFFGDELESLRHFDPITQISKEEIVRATVPPAGELAVLRKIVTDETQNSLSNVRDKLATLLDYLPHDAIFLLCEPELLIQQAATYAEQIPPNDPFFISWDQFLDWLNEHGSTRLEVSDSDTASPGLLRTDLSLDAAPRSATAAADPTTEITDDAEEPSLVRAWNSPHMPLFQGLDAFRPVVDHAPAPQVAEAQRREFFIQLHRWSRQGYDVHVFCNNDGERQRFKEIWREYGFDVGPRAPNAESPEADPKALSTTIKPQISTHLGSLTRGFIYEEGKLVAVTDAEIFGRYKVQRPRRLKSPHAQTTRSILDIDFAELEEGDYVVHLQHGIGRYLGLKVLPATMGRKATSGSVAASESGQECLVLEYAASDPEQPPPKLYVPVREAHLVSKYVGAGKARPALNTLGGARWNKTKAQATQAIRDLAGELLTIQAARESQPGHAFSPDTSWQREFESSFLYEETPDQIRAILETKTDMETARPMDRLICGDVGYGKTEVAIRAAFKAVMGGRQVAILVPTTVLAQQHLNTFRERMSDYPLRVEMLSRFRTRHEQQRVIRDLASGAVDIVIGTHRLVQDDIVFKDLGLVVIDEEQRFGVLQKEKFKQLRQLVDVLTLSATPIPRTLYLALTGAREMSTIVTPPQDRLPVETIVTQYDERVIRDAIQRELNRQGQVFFLHNRVDTIDAIALRLRALVPHARIVIGHGQMHSDDLEEVMTRFVNGEADVLLSTTIIESGLDIPNANTIIIDRADRFGLSELYQLRGRVGRYKHQAHAYLLLPRHAGLLTDARKRISAIKQYSSLGSGFKIAMRDLEIRGAGNLLGPEQSGHIAAVGFDLYCQLLKQSVSALKGEKVKQRVEVQVRFDFLALNPAEEMRAKRPGSRVQGSKSKVPSPKSEEPDIHVARETATYISAEQPVSDGLNSVLRTSDSELAKAAAYIPFDYIMDARQRIEIYRRLAQVTDKIALAQLKSELRDRFGPLPDALEILFKVTEIKILASEREITVIETREGKLMLTRNNDYITLGGKFPRLAKKSAAARLNEIKRLLLAH